MKFHELELLKQSEEKAKFSAAMLGICFLLTSIIFIICLCFPAHAYEYSCSTPNCMRESSIRPKHVDIRPEPVVPVERYRVDAFKNDPAVLVVNGGVVSNLTGQAVSICPRDKMASPISHGEYQLPAKASPSEPIVNTKFEEDRIDLSELPLELATKVRKEME